jgi:peptidyl-prolyl cis-trans isomerase D
MIRRKAALVKARAAGVDRDPQTRALVDQLIASRFIEAALAKELNEDPTVTDAAIEAFYKSNAPAYQIPARVRAGVILFKVGEKAEPAKRAELRARAMAILEQARTLDATGFAQLVQSHSEEQSTRYIGGDTGWLTAGQTSPRWPGAVVRTAFELKQPGQVAPLVETPTGFFIVRVAEFQEAGVLPLAQVQDAIRHELSRKMRLEQEQAFFRDLKQGLDIKVYQQVFDGLPPPTSTITATVPKVPGG